MRKLSTHAEWLRLVEISGPFLSTTMLERAFPQGLEAIDTPRKQKLRLAYDEWQDAVDENDPQLEELHREWVRLVLEDILEYDREVLVGRDKFGAKFSFKTLESPVTFVPDLAVMISGDERPRLYISIHSPGTDLEKAKSNDGWPIPIVERMTLLCRSTGVRLGLITNGERWMLVNAPGGSTSSHTSWYSRLWFQEPVTLKAFLSLFGVRRCFGPTDETLESLLEESLKQQEEVTDTLGEQVKRAVEVLVQCLDKADQDRNRELLHDVSPSELYEAGLTIMMRLVFVLCAEERGLLLLDDPVYDQHYAISTLRSQLAEDADRLGPEVLDRRHDAWARLLSVFRAIYGGIEHQSLRMPALGGSLFDPDRFAFLEGRVKGTKWLETISAPLPIDNRTVLLLLEALQILEQPGGALLLSYKALDVENIGHVYEGLLEHTIKRVPEVTLGLIGSQKAKSPNISLKELEVSFATSETVFIELVQEMTQRSGPAIRNALTKQVDDILSGRVLTVCGGDVALTNRILPFANLLRTDAWGDPIIYRSHSFMVTLGADRRETGTHYTPKILTETVVATTMESIAFIGPSEGKAREEWQLKSPEELLNLKICDPTMGSGAFLVQVCRWLAEHLVKAWLEAEKEGKYISVDGLVVAKLEGNEPMPANLDDRLVLARRLVAERCLYGVDLNPLAVELAKLSIWLITMAKDRPFGFLDHNLKSGDSLLGVHCIDQLTKLRLNPSVGQHHPHIFGQNIEAVVNDAINLRKQLRLLPIRDIHDVELMAKIDKEVKRKLESVELVADAMIGEALSLGGVVRSLDKSLDVLATYAGDLLNGNAIMSEQISHQAKISLSVDLLDGKPPRKPFHWVIEYPEIFEQGGFDGIVGNPPFMGGSMISGNMGEKYREYLVGAIAENKRGNADLCAFFFLRVATLLRDTGIIGLIGTSTISQGDTREVGLDQINSKGLVIIQAINKMPWPGRANVEIALVWLWRGHWQGRYVLNSKPSRGITTYLLETGDLDSPPNCLKANQAKSFTGAKIYGQGFILEDHEVTQLVKLNPANKDVIFPYLNGEDINRRPDQSPSRSVINFFEWPLMRTKLDKSWKAGNTKERKKWITEGIVPEDYPGPVASDYPDCLKIVEEKVRPERLALKDNSDGKRRKHYWWQYGRISKGLDTAITQLDKYLIHPLTSKYHSFFWITEKMVVSHMTVAVVLNSWECFALLQSDIHYIWALRYGNKLGGTPQYTPSDCFQTFPFPLVFEQIGDVGQRYYSQRQQIMKERNEGITAIYNRQNNSSEQSSDVRKLRELHVEMDIAVANAYGWKDLDFQHDFYETIYGPRFTFNDESHNEVLQRLLKLNNEYFEMEVSQGLHISKLSPLRDTKNQADIFSAQQQLSL